MRLPFQMVAGMAGYIAKNRLRPKPEWQKTVTPPANESNPFKIVYTHESSAKRPLPHPMLKKRFPLVFMLEPLHACNLTCTGCGRIREYENTISKRLTIEQCLAADAECGAPTVSICGGEPMLYPELGELARKLIERGRNLILCTNGMFIKKRIDEFKPSDCFFFNIHLDGLEKNHDIAVEREGVYQAAIEGIRIAKGKGFKVMSNTTVYRETDMNEIWQLFEFLETLGVDAHTISPAYGYAAVNDQEIFMTRDDIHEKFKDIDKMQKRFPIIDSPVYTDFLKGERELPCTVWGSPTYNVLGWKGPCYVITDAHYKTFDEFMTQTQWANYGPGNDPRCEHCMMHVGFEPSAAVGVNSKFSDPMKSLTWLLT